MPTQTSRLFLLLLHRQSVVDSARLLLLFGGEGKPRSCRVCDGEAVASVKKERMVAGQLGGCRGRSNKVDEKDSRELGEVDRQTAVVAD